MLLKVTKLTTLETGMLFLSVGWVQHWQCLLKLSCIVLLPSTPARCRRSTHKKERENLHDLILKNSSVGILNTIIFCWNDSYTIMFIYNW